MKRSIKELSEVLSETLQTKDETILFPTIIKPTELIDTQRRSCASRKLRLTKTIENYFAPK